MSLSGISNHRNEDPLGSIGDTRIRQNESSLSDVQKLVLALAGFAKARLFRLISTPQVPTVDAGIGNLFGKAAAIGSAMLGDGGPVEEPLSICIIKRKPDIFHPKNYAFVGLVRALVIFNCVWLPERQGK